MAIAVDTLVASGRGQTIDVSSLSHLAMGTLVTLDLAAARRRCEKLFGLECVEYAPGRMMARDRRAKYMMQNGLRDFFVLDIVEVDAIEHPQTRDNHWGFSVGTREEVHRIRKAALERAEEFGLKTVLPVTPMHGSNGFYIADTDENWWEVEFRRGVTNDLLFSQGDWNAEGRESFPVIDPPLPIAATESEVLGDEAFMTHGTTAVADCDASRAFYEDILGLRTVHHAKPANCFAGAGDFATIGVGIRGDQDQGPENRFVLLVDDDDDLATIHDKVVAGREHYGLTEVSPIEPSPFGGKSFLVRTRDRVWFELSSRSRRSIVDMFERAAA